jgi:type 1 glutamine amidotransferase
VENLDRFVTSGGGLLALHSATASFKKDGAFAALLGGRFEGHSPVRGFTLRAASDAGEEFRAIPEIPLRDEIYQHACGNDIQVRFTAEYQNRTYPMAWTRSHGRGRVFYFAPGHKAATWDHPEVIRLLAAALDWVTGVAPVGSPAA